MLIDLTLPDLHATPKPIQEFCLTYLNYSMCESLRAFPFQSMCGSDVRELSCLERLSGGSCLLQPLKADTIQHPITMQTFYIQETLKKRSRREKIIH